MHDLNQTTPPEIYIDGQQQIIIGDKWIKMGGRHFY